MQPFTDRTDAGQRLGERLVAEFGDEDVKVIGLPRGGVPVAYQVALALGSPMDIIVVRKVGVPRQPEVAMGALGEGGVLIVEHDTLHAAGVSGADLQRAVSAQRRELRRRTRSYRRARPAMSLKNEVVVIVDDGVATGATAQAAVIVARNREAIRVVVATPVSSNAAATRLGGVADGFITLQSVGGPFAVGQWYSDFGATSDAEVINILRETNRSNHQGVPRST